MAVVTSFTVAVCLYAPSSPSNSGATAEIAACAPSTNPSLIPDESGMYSCDTCPYLCDSLYSMLLHQRAHVFSLPLFSCPVVGCETDIFIKREQLREHCMREHGTAPSVACLRGCEPLTRLSPSLQDLSHAVYAVRVWVLLLRAGGSSLTRTGSSSAVIAALHPSLASSR